MQPRCFFSSLQTGLWVDIDSILHGRYNVLMPSQTRVVR